MSDLENFVNQPGRDKLVKDVRNKIKELGITYIYYQFVSVTGRIVGKGVPADHWETLAETPINGLLIKHAIKLNSLAT